MNRLLCFERRLPRLRKGCVLPRLSAEIYPIHYVWHGESAHSPTVDHRDVVIPLACPRAGSERRSGLVGWYIRHSYQFALLSDMRFQAVVSFYDALVRAISETIAHAFYAPAGCMSSRVLSNQFLRPCGSLRLYQT